MQTPQASEDLKEVLALSAEFYRFRPPEGLRVPILVLQSEIADWILTEAELEMAVKVMKVGRAEGLSGMHTEDVKSWLQKAMRKRESVISRWEIFVRLVQRTFGDGTPPVDLAWATMVLILKVKGEYRGIGLIEVAL